MTIASAPGKVILFGEHAVVYGRPAIAAPVRQVGATAEVCALPDADPGAVWMEAPDIGFSGWLAHAASDQPLARMVRLVLEAMALPQPPALRIRLTSTIPIAAGLGSGAAVSVALGRALSQHLGHPLPPDRLSALAFEVERLHHGTPSGIDNSVVTYERPVYYVKGQALETLRVPRPFHLVVADSGEPSPTRIAVSQVREAWQRESQRYEGLFDKIADVVRHARRSIEAGDTASLGPVMDENQALLEALGVNTPCLERLLAAAHAAGALGAKVSGAGLGGNVIALVEPGSARVVSEALQEAGAARTIYTEVSA